MSHKLVHYIRLISSWSIYLLCDSYFSPLISVAFRSPDFQWKVMLSWLQPSLEWRRDRGVSKPPSHLRMVWRTCYHWLAADRLLRIFKELAKVTVMYGVEPASHGCFVHLIRENVVSATLSIVPITLPVVRDAQAKLSKWTLQKLPTDLYMFPVNSTFRASVREAVFLS